MHKLGAPLAPGPRCVSGETNRDFSVPVNFDFFQRTRRTAYRLMVRRRLQTRSANTAIRNGHIKRDGDQHEHGADMKE